MRKFLRNTVLVVIAGVLFVGLTACDRSEDNIEAPGVSSTSPTV